MELKQDNGRLEKRNIWQKNINPWEETIINEFKKIK